MSGKLIVFGTGSFAELAHYYFTHDSSWQVAGFTVNGDRLDSDRFCRLPVVPFEEIEEHFPPGSFEMFVAVGYSRLNSVREAVYRKAKRKGFNLVTYISSKCTYWGKSIGNNCFVFEDNTIQPFVEIGDNVILWSGNHIGHHSRIGHHCFISSHVVVSGHVVVGSHCFLGVNATIRDGIEIGKQCIIGAGAVIMKSTREREVHLAQRSRPDDRTSDMIEL